MSELLRQLCPSILNFLLRDLGEHANTVAHSILSQENVASTYLDGWTCCDQT